MLSAWCFLLPTHSLGPSWQANYLVFTTYYYFYLLNGNIFTLWYVFCTALSPCASLGSTLQRLTPLVPENAGAVKLHSAWQHHFYSKLHIIIIDLEVWPCYTALQADSFFPETTFQCLLCPHGDWNVMVIRSFEDYAMSIKRPPDKYFFCFVYCPEKSLLLLVSTTMLHSFENEHAYLQTSKSMFTLHSKG